MKFKKIMLVTFVLLAILTIGAVSASDDISTDEALAVEDAQDISVDVLSADEDSQVLSNSTTTDSDPVVDPNGSDEGGPDGGDDEFIDAEIWDEDECGKLYTDYPLDDVVSVRVPQGHEGTIFVEVNGTQKAEWTIEYHDEDSWSYSEWGLDVLGMREVGDYYIAVKHDSEILKNATVTVYEFNNDEFRALLVYDAEEIRLYCPEGIEGTMTVTTEVETSIDNFETVFNETFNIADYSGWSTWKLEDLEFKHDGLWTVFRFIMTNATDELFYFQKGYSYEGYYEEDNRFYVPDQINVNNPDEHVIYIYEFPGGIDEVFTVVISQNGTDIIEKQFNKNDDREGEYWLTVEQIGLKDYGAYDLTAKFTRDGEEIEDTYAASFDAVNLVININDREEMSDIFNWIYEIRMDMDAEGRAITYLNGEKRFEKDIKDLRFAESEGLYGHIICLNDFNITETGEYNMSLEVYDGEGKLLRNDTEITREVNVGGTSLDFISPVYGNKYIVVFYLDSPVPEDSKLELYLNGTLAGEKELFSSDDIILHSGSIFFDFNEEFLDIWDCLKVGYYSAEIRFISGDNNVSIAKDEFTVYPLYVIVDIWDSDLSGKLYNDTTDSILEVHIPRCLEGAVSVSVNGTEIGLGGIEFEYDDFYSDQSWNLEDLGMSEPGTYNIVVKVDGKTIFDTNVTVYEFNNDEFRALITYADEILRIYCPEGSEGNMTIITEKSHEEDYEYDQINYMRFELCDKYYGWNNYDLDDLGLDHDNYLYSFTVTVTNATGDEIFYFRGAKWGGENEEEDDVNPLDDYEFRFKNPNDEFDDSEGYDFEYEKSSSTCVGHFYIPGDFENTTLYVYRNGVLFAEISPNNTHGFFNHDEQARGFEVWLNLTKLKDKDILTFCLPDRKEDNNRTVVVEDKGETVFFHDDYDPERLEFDVFYGNITTGALNSPDLMGPHFNGKFVILVISDAYGITDGNIIISDENSVIKTIPLSECEKKYDYGSVGYEYSINMTNGLSMIPADGENYTVKFESGNVTFIQKRVKFDDYIYRITLAKDVLDQYTFNLPDDELTNESDIAIAILTHTNRQAILIDLAGGYFLIEVNGVKVENAGEFSFKTWANVNNSHWDENDEDYLRNRDEYPTPESFLDEVHKYWGSELELFRLTSWYQGAEKLNITLADLGITKSGSYEIVITHCPNVAGDLDGSDSEYFIIKNTTVLRKTITVNFHEVQEPVDPSLAITAVDITYGGTSTVTVTTNKTFTGDVIVQVGNSNFTIKITNGEGSIALSNLAAGQYLAKVFFAETELFTSSEKNTTFTVNKAATSVASLAATIKTTYGSGGSIVVQLNDANGKPMSGKYVTVVLAGKVYSGNTNAKGRIYVTIPNNLPGNSKLYPQITFAGDENYAGSTAKCKVLVFKATPQLTYLKKATYKRSDKQKKYTVVLKTDLGYKMKNKKVTVKFSKKLKFVGTTNNKGKVTLKLNKLTKRGTYVGYVIFGGNSNYNGLTKKVKITVK